MKRISRSKIQTHIFVCFGIVPNGALVGYVANQLSNVTSAFDTSRFDNLGSNLKLTSMK
jgi:hypothetical protein